MLMDILNNMATCDYCYYSVDEMTEYFKKVLANEYEEEDE